MGVGATSCGGDQRVIRPQSRASITGDDALVQGCKRQFSTTFSIWHPCDFIESAVGAVVAIQRKIGSLLFPVRRQAACTGSVRTETTQNSRFTLNVRFSATCSY